MGLAGLPIAVFAAACGSHEANIESPDPYEQYLWLIRLDRSANQEELDRVRGAMSSASAMVREGAVIAVGKAGNPDLIPLAVERLGDSEPGVRGAAVEALARLGHAPGQAKVQERLRIDTAPEVRRTAARALEKFPLNRAAGADLVAALSDADGGVAVLAHETLVKLTRQQFDRSDVKGWQEWIEKQVPP
jgi:HEAT repeat protein